jgi:hypothetical protein
LEEESNVGSEDEDDRGFVDPVIDIDIEPEARWRGCHELWVIRLQEKGETGQMRKVRKVLLIHGLYIHI